MVIQSIIRICGKFHYVICRNDKNYAAFSHDNLAVQTLSKIFSTILYSRQRKRRNTFLNRDKCLECLPSPLMYFCQTTCKTRNSFINWTCGKMSNSFSSVILIQKLLWASDEGFKIASCVTPQTCYLHSIKIWSVISSRWYY